MVTLDLGIKQLYVYGRILARYGTLRPRRVQLTQSQRMLHVDPADGRARRKLIAGTARNKFPRNQRFFREAVSALSPDLVLDVGLNYGECLFSMTYPPQAQLFGFEANVALRPFVEASREEHPNREQIELLFQLVTDGDTGESSFFIDKEWSGGSTAGLDPQNYDQTRYELVRVPRGSVDSAMQARKVEASRLFFKIDVEGYEPGVLRGMQQTLRRTPVSVGFIEFSGSMLSRAGSDVKEYWSELQRQFEIYVFGRDQRVHAGTGKPLEWVEEISGGHFHTDVVLLRGVTSELKDRVLHSWR